MRGGGEGRGKGRREGREEGSDGRGEVMESEEGRVRGGEK